MNIETGFFVSLALNIVIFFSALVLWRYARTWKSQATHSAITGLLNLTGFQVPANALYAAWCRGWFDSLVVVFIDLDHFKQVNTALGHRVADQVLCAAADILCEHFCRGYDLTAHRSGDEFILLIPDCPERDLVEKLHAASEQLKRHVSIRYCVNEPPSFTFGYVYPTEIEGGNESQGYPPLDEYVDRAEHIMISKKTGRR